MNWVDYLLLAVFFLSTLAGFGRGFAKEMISLITLAAAFFVASLFSSSLAAMFTSSPAVQNTVNEVTTNAAASQTVSYAALGISFIILFVGTMVVGSLVGYFLNMAFQTGVLGMGNRLLGAIFGLVRGFLINLVVIFIMQLTPLADQPWWQQSQLVPAFQPAVQWLDSFVAPSLAHLKDEIGQQLQGAQSQMINTYQGFSK